MPNRLSRRRFLQAALATLASGGAFAETVFAQNSVLAKTPDQSSNKKNTQPPNVLFVVFDDLNDWVNCLGGYLGTIHTPNMDALAASGTLFTNAHCAIPLCNASRTSTLTGLSPLQTKVLYNTTKWRDIPAMKNTQTLPQYFQAKGYRTVGAGKIFHFNEPAAWNDFWPQNEHGFPPEPIEPDNEHPLKGGPPQNRIDTSFDWGVVDTKVENTPDYQVADHIIRTLQTPQTQPLFLGCGFGKPHLPWYLPKAYFDRYPLDSVQLPAVLQNDLDDVPAAGRALINEYIHTDVVRLGFWKKAVQAYLASITFADEQLGRVLTALRESSIADNTIVVLWSDHGWHLGEKMQWRKLTLWEEATHIPLIISGPGIHAGQHCAAPVSLLDIVPTLADLCQLAVPSNLPGHSLKPLLQMPDAEWPHAAITLWQIKDGNHFALRDQRYRYIRYSDGTEELYDHQQDPHEWHNLAKISSMQTVKSTLAAQLTSSLAAMNRD
jgi:arylsulfatase A-like enzyme